MDDSPEPALRRLEALLNDERARRAHAEQALAEERRRVALWRRRAEERAERIERLTSEPLRLRRGKVGLRRRGGDRRADPSRPDPSRPDPSRPDPGADTVREPTPDRGTAAVPTVVAATEEELRPLLQGLVTVVDAAREDLRAGADLVALSPAGLAAVTEWTSLEARPPLLVVDDGASPPGPVAGPRDAVLTERPDAWPGWRHFDPLRVSTGTLPVPEAVPPLAVEGGGVRDATGRMVGVTGVAESIDLRLPIAHGDPDGDHQEWLRRSTVLTRRILDGYRPAAAAERLLDGLGVAAPHRPRRITAVLVSNRPDDVAPAIRRIAAQRGVEVEAVVGLHGIGGGAAATALLEELELPGRVVEMDGSWPLGKCTNVALDHGTGELWAKFDDDDVYGPHHLLDSMAALDATGADLVGKAVAYVHIEERGVTHLYRQGREDAWDQFVFGATFVGTRALWERLRFPHRYARIDSVFLTAARRSGFGVYSTTRDEYMVVRRRGAGHTWGADPELFRSASTEVWEGLQAERVVVR